MLLLACATLALAALVYVFWLTPEPVRVKSRAEREREYLVEKRAVLYENLRDLHLEYRMGKLSDADYQQMKSRYQEELAALLREFEEKLELPPLVAAPVPGRCLRCGRDNPVENRFCGACGAELPSANAQA
ncbi:MAG TPA: zinc ribbon domain-containing protein [Candidatus Acidoferrales bacterium]|nr:zinc ribbon domain-containing protein [Candidatus Acidoferrales bacterium]